MMKNFTKHNWVKAVAMVLICAFVSFDITWATGGDFRGMSLRRSSVQSQISTPSMNRGEQIGNRSFLSSKLSFLKKLGIGKWLIIYAVLALGGTALYAYYWSPPALYKVKLEQLDQSKSKFLKELNIAIVNIDIKDEYYIAQTSEGFEFKVKQRIIDNESLLRFLKDSNRNNIKIDAEKLTEPSEIFNRSFQIFNRRFLLGSFLNDLADRLVGRLKNQMLKYNSAKKQAEQDKEMKKNMFLEGDAWKPAPQSMRIDTGKPVDLAVISSL